MTLTQADYENARGNTGLLCSQLGLWISTKAIESWSSADNTDLLDNKTWALILKRPGFSSASFTALC